MTLRPLAALISLMIMLCSVTAQAQGVVQSGAIQPGHSVKWIAKNIIGDAGGAFLTGPNVAATGNIPTFNSGTLLQDSGIPLRGVANTVVAWQDSPGATLKCSVPGSSTLVSTTGTTSSGLEECFRAMCDSDLSFRMDGMGNSNSVIGVINISAPIDFRGLRSALGDRAACPIQGRSIYLGWCGLNFTANQGSKDGIIFDSLIGATIVIECQTVYQGNGYAIAFRPTHPAPDGFTTISDSTVRIVAPGSQSSGTPKLVVVDATNGAVINFNFYWQEINGGGCPGCGDSATIGLDLIGGSNGIASSYFRGGRIHGFTATGLNCGQNTTDGAGIGGNMFDFSLAPIAGGGVAAQINCPNNIFNFPTIDGNEAGTNAFTGIAIGAGVGGNKFRIGRNFATTSVSGANVDVLNNEFDW